MSVLLNRKVKLFQEYSKPLALVVASLEKNEITRDSAKAILREIISNPDKNVELLIESYTAAKEKMPASKEEIHHQVKLFLQNIDFYFLRERIEGLMFNYFYHSRKNKGFISKLRVFKDIRKIVKENDVVCMIQKQDKERFSDASKNIQLSSRNYKTTAEGIQDVLNECLKLNDIPPPKDIFRYYYNGCSRGRINFFCQPIMETLDFKTDGKTIMEEFMNFTV